MLVFYVFRMFVSENMKLEVSGVYTTFMLNLIASWYM